MKSKKEDIQMKKCMPIKKIALWVSAVFIILVIGVIYLGLNVQKQQVLNLNKQSLQMLANEKAAQVNNFLENQKEKLEIIAVMNVFKEAVLYPNDAIKTETAKKRIKELKDIIPGISILNNEGIVIIGEVDLPGTDYSQHPYFIAKRQDISFERYYDPFRKEDYYAIIGPIYDNTNKITGRIAFDVELKKISNLMKKTFDGGENDEVYLIDENELLLSSSEYIDRSNKNGVLIQEIESEGAVECLEHTKKYGKNESVEEHTEEVIQYTSYMGNEVFGAHAYVPSVMGCVIAEKSADEIIKFSLTGYVINIFNVKEVKNEE